MRLVPFAGLSLLCLALPGTSSAASSYDNCTGFINSLPAVISTQGVWCMNKDLSTATSAGVAISITGNNVTLDCNHFKLGGLAAGLGTSTIGLLAVDKNNVTVRNCNVRGFYYGLMIQGEATGGHVIEDSRFDSNTYTGVHVQGNGSLVRRNQVINTGDSTLGNQDHAVGIMGLGNVDVVDNVVSDVSAPEVEGAGTALGIRMGFSSSATVMRNTVRGIVGSADSVGVGIDASGATGTMIQGNTLYVGGNMFSNGILCSGNGASFLRDNSVPSGDVVFTGDCVDMGGNGPFF